MTPTRGPIARELLSFKQRQLLLILDRRFNGAIGKLRDEPFTDARIV